METNLIGIFSDTFWYVAPIIVALTTSVTGFLNQWFKLEQNWAKQLVSWAVASVFSVASWALHLITFGTPVWAGVVALCVVTGLSSNGFYDIDVIKRFVNKFTGK
jgi:hypothetical protein